MSHISLFRDSCKGVEDCGICIYVCPKSLFESSEEMNTAGYIPPRVVREGECTRCLSCMISCPDMAIVVEKEKNEETP
ncbi:MAG: hypothetical protein MUP74_02385 [Desulfobacterales bacterium]|nr:hypothetical protein [Desulfobacterales bacterium]